MLEDYTIEDARANGFSSLELYRLWHWASCFPESSFGCFVMEAAKKVEEEVEERFVELPVDSKGIPINVGERLTDGEYTFTVASMSYHGYKSWAVLNEDGNAWACCDVEHVPDPAKQLKPCPFCGSNDLYIVEQMIDREAPFMSADDKTIGIFCNTCKQTVFLEANEDEGRSLSTEQMAVEAWNKRA